MVSSCSDPDCTMSVASSVACPRGIKRGAGRVGASHQGSGGQGRARSAALEADGVADLSTGFTTRRLIAIGSQ